ncbi:MAG: VanZ family protein [Paenibacillus sp.]|nr:VanZ family protein [Paenibacillus sp.]
MKTLLIILWGVLLFVFTCASDSGFWVAGTFPTFHWSTTPDFHELTNMDLMPTFGYIIRKIGHFSGFAVLAAFFYRQNKSIKKSIMYSVFYAIFTEFIQLYFGRDGRLYDVVIDTAGILFGMTLITMAYRRKIRRKMSDSVL